MRITRHVTYSLDTRPRAHIDSKVRRVGQVGRSAPQYRACKRKPPHADRPETVS